MESGFIMEASPPQTVSTFTKLGFRTMPIGKQDTILTREAESTKKCFISQTGDKLDFRHALPSDWTNVYGSKRTAHKDTPLGGLICGRLQSLQKNEVEVIAIDCDNGAAWELFNALNPDYLFKSKSINKPGGTIFYRLPQDLRTIPQYSIKTDTMCVEYMAKRASGPNSMVYLPTTANKTKAPIAKGAELTEPPQQIIELIKLLRPKQISRAIAEAPSKNLPFNAPLITQFVAESKAEAEANGANGIFGKLDNNLLVEKVYHIFTPKKYRDCPHYVKHSWVHPNSDELLTLGSWSDYIIGVSAIAGADPSISGELYAEFMQTINAQIDDPMPAQRYMTEVISPMVTQKASIKGVPIWKYNDKWDKVSHTIVNQYGETLEYFILEEGATKFIEYNHSSKSVIELSGIKTLRYQIYSKDTSATSGIPPASIVKKLKLISLNNSVKSPIGIFTDSTGHTVLNTAEPVYSLQVLRTPEIYEQDIDETNLYVQAFNIFISHLLNNDGTAVLFLKQLLAYHGRHLENVPVILYMIGVGGAGKSHFAKFMELLFGSNATSRPSAKQITSQYNSFLQNTAILILTETSDTSIRDQEGIKALLKTVTGEGTVDIEEKYQSLQKNKEVFALPILIANDPWYQEDSADRRLFSIMPKETIIESKPIEEFELHHGIKIIDYIAQGIIQGTISKYLSGFLPKLLPEVPLTEDKQNLSMEQRDPIMVVKNVVASHNWNKLFDLFEEYSVDLFFTVMESKKIRDKNAIFKNQLVELVKNIRGSDSYTLTDAEISKAFTIRWLPKQARQYRPNASNSLAMRLGYIKWVFDIATVYETWKIEKMKEEDPM